MKIASCEREWLWRLLWTYLANTSLKESTCTYKLNLQSFHQWKETHLPGLDKIFISQERVWFSTILSYSIFKDKKGQIPSSCYNFPLNTQISQERAYHLSTFFHPFSSPLPQKASHLPLSVRSCSHITEFLHLHKLLKIIVTKPFPKLLPRVFINTYFIKFANDL